MMTLEEMWENLRQDPEIKATMEEVDKSYKLFKKIENLIVADLEAKLAESEQRCQECKHLNKKIELNIKNKLMKENQELKQQLAEERNRNKKLNHEAQKYYEDAYCNNFQNQKTIAELEKLKEHFKRDFEIFTYIDATALYKQLDQQIKSLKGEK